MLKNKEIKNTMIKVNETIICSTYIALKSMQYSLKVLAQQVRDNIIPDRYFLKQLI